jgi:hypothetical protein
MPPKNVGFGAPETRFFRIFSKFHEIFRNFGKFRGSFRPPKLGVGKLGTLGGRARPPGSGEGLAPPPSQPWGRDVDFVAADPKAPQNSGRCRDTSCRHKNIFVATLDVEKISAKNFRATKKFSRREKISAKNFRATKKFWWREKFLRNIFGKCRRKYFLLENISEKYFSVAKIFLLHKIFLRNIFVSQKIFFVGRKVSVKYFCWGVTEKFWCVRNFVEKNFVANM